MAIRKIRISGDPILTKKTKKVEEFRERLAQLLDDMQETMKENNGIGIAGPQVGVLRSVVVILNDDCICELVNPEIVESSGEQEITEGCLSFPGQYGITRRPMKVKILAQDRNGKEFTLEAEKLAAAAICHEIDHLSGILFKSRVIKMIDKN
ncbi:MAG: peptide deformylase [Oscillospiraceae bacterium]|nr:peptide deformylase [Oscillospiraceae bacterium]